MISGGLDLKLEKVKGYVRMKILSHPEKIGTVGADEMEITRKSTLELLTDFADYITVNYLK